MKKKVLLSLGVLCSIVAGTFIVRRRRIGNAMSTYRWSSTFVLRIPKDYVVTDMSKRFTCSVCESNVACQCFGRAVLFATEKAATLTNTSTGDWLFCKELTDWFTSGSIYNSKYLCEICYDSEREVVTLHLYNA